MKNGAVLIVGKRSIYYLLGLIKLRITSEEKTNIAIS